MIRPLQFKLDSIYLLQRKGDNGQFVRVAEIFLGKRELPQFHIFDTSSESSAFPNMPTTEEDWVYEERMKLKARRNNNGGWRGRRGGKRRTERQRRRRSPRIPDTPEVIAQKRAERKAKKERLEREAADATAATRTAVEFTSEQTED